MRHLGAFLKWAAPFAVAVLAFAIPVLGVRAYEYVMTSGYFHVHEVMVDGSERVAREEVLAIAGITPGTHLLDADFAAMATKLEQSPWIRSATIERQLPDRLVVRIAEHHPTAYLAAGELYLVDENAAPFMLAPVALDLRLPVITGVDPDALTHPRQHPEVHHALTGALNLHRMWEAQGLAGRYPLGEIRVDGPRGYVLVIEAQNQRGAGTATPIEVVIGRAPFTEKLYRLEWILEHLHAQGKRPEYVLLDLYDGYDGSVGPGPADAERLGGARVVVKTLVDPEDVGADLPMAAPDGAPPEATPADAPAPAARRPARRAPTNQPSPGAADAVPAIPAPEPESDPDANGESPHEGVPLSGGRPAAEPGLEE